MRGLIHEPGNVLSQIEAVTSAIAARIVTSLKGRRSPMLCIAGMAGRPPALRVVTRRALPHCVHYVHQASFVTNALWVWPH